MGRRRGGADRQYGRKEEFDEQSRLWSIRGMTEIDRPLRSYTWRCDTKLNQYGDSSCVGCGVAHELAARPVEVRNVTYAFAKKIYRRAQKIDRWPGEEPAYFGTSVLAGMKIVRDMGYIKEFRWAFSLREVLMALSYHGPVVVGLPWYTGMVEPDSSGYIHPTGIVEGGHCAMLNANDVTERRVRLFNSYGLSWGPMRGDAYIHWDDLGRLLEERGEACIPLRRARHKRRVR